MRILHIPTATEFIWRDHRPFPTSSDALIMVDFSRESAILCTKDSYWPPEFRLGDATYNFYLECRWDYACTFIDIP